MLLRHDQAQAWFVSCEHATKCSSSVRAHPSMLSTYSQGEHGDRGMIDRKLSFHFAAPAPIASGCGPAIGLSSFLSANCKRFTSCLNLVPLESACLKVAPPVPRRLSLKC
jgi:hypothetical protein